MIRRLNYTGRRRIPRENIRVAIYRNGDIEEFEAAVRCAGLGLPDDAKVFVEAYHKSDWMRFDYGTVARPSVPRDRRLTAFYQGARVLFRVKVVAVGDESGKILAEADRILPLSPDEERDRDPLLPVRVVDGMESEIWRLAWDGGPVLELNRNEPDIKRLLTADPRFKWLILPEVLRAVLTHVVQEEMDADEEPFDGTGRRWLEFAQSIYGEPPPQPGDREDLEVVEAWVGEVVAAFCRRHRAMDHWRIALRPQDDLFSRL
jgi:hypothetical protein